MKAHTIEIRPGKGDVLVNLREGDGVLTVTGNPVEIMELPAGAQLLYTLADGRAVYRSGDRVYVDSAHVYTLGDGEQMVHVDSCGELLLLTTGEGVSALSENGGEWSELRLSNAIPAVSISEGNRDTLTSQIDAYTFETPYSTWSTPLSSVDTAHLSQAVRQAWCAMEGAAARAGSHTGVVVARYALRMNDDNYLWVSEPVVLSEVARANAAVAAVMNVSHSGSGFTGVEATSVAIGTYGVVGAITRGVDRSWWHLIKSIDLLVTDEMSAVNSAGTVTLRAITRLDSGNRTYLLSAQPEANSLPAIEAALLRSSTYTVIACTTDLTGASGFTPVVGGESRSVDTVSTMLTMVGAEGATDALVHNGRYYLLTGDGRLVMSAIGNAMVVEHSRRVTGAMPLALLPVTRPLFWGSAGRYVMYVFTSDGIYAVPQLSSGALGEPRLVYRTVINAAVHPIEGEQGIYYVTDGGRLCLASGSRVETLQQHCAAVGMAMNDDNGELWLMDAAGEVSVLTAGGLTVRRTFAPTQLYHRVPRALAVTAGGSVVDLTREEASDAVPMEYRSRAVAISKTVKRVSRSLWAVDSDGAVQLDLLIWGDRGVSCHGGTLAHMYLSGRAKSPVATIPYGTPVRTVRMGVNGTAPTGASVGDLIVEVTEVEDE